MPANLDNIDLNSEVVSGVREDGVNGFSNVSKVKSKVGLSSDAETLMDSVTNRENVFESGVGDTSVLEAVEIIETHSSKVVGEENGFCEIEGEVREERGCGVVSSSLVREDAIQVENVNVEVKVDIVNDLLPHKKPGNVSPKVSSKGVENQAMEINDEQAKKSEGQNKDATAFDERMGMQKWLPKK
ncbi:hypothetical protein OIU79_028407 [Salix purpurea]|uniref:Uncharacterized protein n=1 Tax=Salix purpurea TaxID=77065 RepID=A0A9Q0VW99_SALPP|nr:hypothetical protein OIU79_028407 [Salix purpurea]